jgi:hypothetical protein
MSGNPSHFIHNTILKLDQTTDLPKVLPGASAVYSDSQGLCTLRSARHSPAQHRNQHQPSAKQRACCGTATQLPSTDAAFCLSTWSSYLMGRFSLPSVLHSRHGYLQEQLYHDCCSIMRGTMPTE